MKHWINKTVSLNDSWGPGADHTLTTPLGQQAVFALRPRYLRDASGTAHLAHFSVDFPSGYLADGWQGVNFVPLGTDAVQGIAGLPPWDLSKKLNYRDMIEAAAGSLSHSATQRLEAVVPYLAHRGQVGYNRVSLFYIENAVQDGSSPDLVVVRIAHHLPVPNTVRAQQTGTGQGPPH